MPHAHADLALTARLGAPPRPLRLLVASRAAAYLGESGPAATGRHDLPVCAVVDAGGLVVPDAVLLPAGTRWEDLLGEHLRSGAPVLLGAHRLRCGTRSVAVTATRDTRVHVTIDAQGAAQRAERARTRLVDRLVDRLAARSTAPGLVHAWTGGSATPDALLADAPGLLGRGPGLTPSGDDLCSGVLLVHRLAGTPGTDAAARAVAELAPRRTTAASALLLCAAGEGRAAPVVGTALATLLDPTAPGPALDTVVDALLALGHTSGADLAAGLVAGLGAVAAAPSTLIHERNCA